MKYITIIIMILGLVSCDTRNKTVKVIETGEKVELQVPNPYSKGDTIVLLSYKDVWEVDVKWIKFESNYFIPENSSVAYYKAIVTN
jgi:hypothetical protein